LLVNAAAIAAAVLVAPASGGRDHAKHPRPKADSGVEKPAGEGGAAGEVTGAAGVAGTMGMAGVAGVAGAANASSTDAGDAPVDLPADVGETPDVPAPPAPGVDAGSDSKAGSTVTGKACQRDVDCVSAHCREGVCCEAACADKCESCLNAKTGKPDGTCAPVKAGLSHASDCMAADPTTCGLDGTCDGAGACRRHVAGTPCAPEACSDGTSVATYTPARTCNGTGTCAGAMTSNCSGTYRCGGTKCRTTCIGVQDCVSGAYCSGNACLAKKADKELCSTNSECLTGTCGGRCCAAGCTCTQPSKANVLKNPGIDMDSSGWTIAGGTLSRSLSDFEKCPYSGSLMAIVPPGGNAHLSQCVANTPFSGDFNFGYQGRIDGEGSVVCQVRFYSGFNCDADLVITNETSSLSTHFPWQMPKPDSLPDGTPVEGANSALLDCSMSNASTSDASSFYLDALFISRSPTQY
jgi:hypothetical protein